MLPCKPAVAVLLPQDVEKLTYKFWSLVDRRDQQECWRWTAGRTGPGYGQIRWKSQRDGAHRMAWALTHGPIPNGMHVLHKCDVRLCCNPSHLFLGTNADNVADKTAKGRSPGRPKLTPDQTQRLIERRCAGERAAELAVEFGVTPRRVEQLSYAMRQSGGAS